MKVLATLGLFVASSPLSRFAKHRVFMWLTAPTLPDHQLIVFAREDDFFFGVLQSRIHEVWALRQGTRHETRPRYTPTSTFETFPFPVVSESQQEAIAAAARELEQLRSRWLRPPEWMREDTLTFPASADGPWARFVEDVGKKGIGTAKYVRLVPEDATTKLSLQKRTVTRLYNQKPTWLVNVHKALDDAVFVAYGWQPDMSDDQLLARLLELNLSSTPAAT